MDTPVSVLDQPCEVEAGPSVKGGHLVLESKVVSLHLLSLPDQTVPSRLPVPGIKPPEPLTAPGPQTEASSLQRTGLWLQPELMGLSSATSGLYDLMGSCVPGLSFPYWTHGGGVWVALLSVHQP